MRGLKIESACVDEILVNPSTTNWSRDAL